VGSDGNGKTHAFSLRCVQDPTPSIASSPTFSPVAGTYTSAQSVTLSSTSGAIIYYTVDGSAPTTSSTLYSGAISVGSTETVKAIAVKSGMTSSTVSSAAYTITTGQTSDTFTDARDGHVYKTVVIGTQTWMAQNLNFTPASSGDSSWCYGGVASNCTKYGRLYQWPAAMGLAAIYNTTLRGGSDVKHQGICPSGWHVPNDAEWTKLTDTTLASSTVGMKLKANNTLWSSNTGTDDYGFSVLPAGYRNYDGSFIDLGGYANFWSASEYDASYAWYRYFSYDNALVRRYDNVKSDGFSLRCLED
jgi:uncharacterized protein (TIGR02145 family)